MLWRLVFMVISQRHHRWGCSLLPCILAFWRHPTVNERKLSHRSLSQSCARDKRRVDSLGKQFHTITRFIVFFLSTLIFSSSFFPLAVCSVETDPVRKGHRGETNLVNEMCVHCVLWMLFYYHFSGRSTSKTDPTFLHVLKRSTKQIFDQWI